MNYGVLLAGGMGTRLGLPTPKQFLKLGEKTLLQHTIEKFVASSDISFIVVVVPVAWFEQSLEILNQMNLSNVAICTGGETRQESLYKGLLWLREKFQITDSDLVVSHDVARPFVTLNMIRENIEVCQRFGAADTVVPSADTIVESKDGLQISSVPVRKNMYLGQTPQTFYVNSFISIYKRLDKDYLDKVTDAAKILRDNGIHVGLVKGDVSNMKITTLFDLKIAEAVISK